MKTKHKPRNVLITGGSSGIGYATVKTFSYNGDRVWFTYLHGENRANELINSLKSEVAYTPKAIKFDQSSSDSLASLIKILPKQIDIIINNAALGSKTVELAGDYEWSQQDQLLMQTNCLGPLWLSKYYIPGMLKRKYGKILMLSSVGGGITAFPGFRDTDGMSKAALAFITKKWAAELIHSEVEVFCVCPGAVDTPMFRQSTLNKLSSQELEKFISRLPKGRLIKPEEISELLWWLTLPAAIIMHGAVIDASMGLGVHPGCISNR